MLKRILIASCFPLLAFTCCDEPMVTPCSTPATVKDLTGLDACGFVLELEDGTRLEPVPFAASSQFQKPNSPLADFELADDKKVFIDYELAEGWMTACMAGQTATITCICEVSASGH